MKNINNLNTLPERVKKALEKINYDDVYSYTERSNYVEVVVSIYGDIEIYKVYDDGTISAA